MSGEGDVSNGGNNDASASSAAMGHGRWRIPLSAYHQLMTLRTSDRDNVVEGIPPEQLRAATLGRESSRRDYPSVDELVRRGVGPSVCRSLAPYQRGGVGFVLDRGGRALLADEMGLGKTVQAIAAMSAYRDEDWPLLVLCPSTARYHWEAEFRCWLGSDGGGKGVGVGAPSMGDGSPENKTNRRPVLQNSQINVLTSGRDPLFVNNLDGTSTRVVICSIGLIVNLASVPNDGDGTAAGNGAPFNDRSFPIQRPGEQHALRGNWRTLSTSGPTSCPIRTAVLNRRACPSPRRKRRSYLRASGATCSCSCPPASRSPSRDRGSG